MSVAELAWKESSEGCKIATALAYISLTWSWAAFLAGFYVTYFILEAKHHILHLVCGFGYACAHSYLLFASDLVTVDQQIKLDQVPD